jgi:hypothetical protein
VSFPVGAVIGFFLGFAFGVGCALAVMYSIYMGGYRAAVRDTRLDQVPERLRRVLAGIDRNSG